MGNHSNQVIGKRTNKWNTVRNRLRKQFEQQGITRCEICQGTFGLSFAHSKKRRFIQTDEEWMEVALLCQPCHEKIEFSGHEAMYKAITDIIKSR